MSALRSGLVSGIQQPGILRRIWPVNNGIEEDFNINIVIVPEVGSAAGRTLLVTPYRWLLDLHPSAGVKAQILMFEYSLNTTGEPVWPSFVQRGGELVESILQQAHTFSVFHRPLIFICHGLGGMILKKALSTYGLNYNPVFQRLLDVHSGIMFLGTPHPTYANPTHWPVLSHILRSSMKLPHNALVQAENEVVIIANVSLKFEEAGIEVPILTAYETKSTKISSGMVWARKMVLVTRALAETSLRYEKLVAVHKSHRDICIVEQSSDLFREFLAMVQAIVAGSKPQSIPAVGPPVTKDLDDFTWASTAPDVGNQKVLQETGPNVESKEANFGSTETSGFEFIPGVLDLPQSRPFPKLPCHWLGPETQNRNFVGREDVLAQIDKALKIPIENQPKPSSRDFGPRLFALTGLGGLGKSSIALEYVYLHKEEYEAIFWIQADNNNSIAESFGQFARELKILNPSEKSDLVVSHSMVMEWLLNPVKQLPSDCEGKTPFSPLANWLIVFDNADDLDVLHDYWPATGNGAILLTSRDPLAKVYPNPHPGIDLEPLSSEESSTLMLKISGYEANPGNVDQSMELAARLGGLPIAITQMASMIRGRDLTFKEFLDLYEEEDSKKELLTDQDRYRHTLSTLWGLEDLGSGSRCLLDVLSLLDPDNIHESLIMKHFPEMPMNDFPSTNLLYIEARKGLIKSSLVKREKDQGQLLLHRLIQDVTRTRMSTEELQVAFELAVNILSQNWPKESHLFSHETSLWPEADVVVSHVLKIADIYSRNLHWEIPIDVLRDLAYLLQKGGWHVAEKGNFKVAERMFASALKICEDNPGEMPELLADALFCCSSHAADTNQFKLHIEFAQKHFNQRMKVERQKPSLGLGAGMAHSEMGLACLVNEMYEKAIEYSITARHINGKTPEFLSGSYWPFFAIIHHAQALIGLNRDDEAVDMILETLRWREAKYGPNDTESFKLGYALQVLGMIRERQGNRTESMSLYLRAFASYKATIGLNHHRMGHIMVKLAEEYSLLKQVDATTVFFDQALRIFGGHSAYKPEYARTTFKKAEFLMAIGKDKEAMDLFFTAKSLYSELVPSHTNFQNMPTLEDFNAVVAIWAR